MSTSLFKKMSIFTLLRLKCLASVFSVAEQTSCGFVQKSDSAAQETPTQWPTPWIVCCKKTKPSLFSSNRKPQKWQGLVNESDRNSSVEISNVNIQRNLKHAEKEECEWRFRAVGV